MSPILTVAPPLRTETIMGTKKIAIACQGGGTHAAFAWGVLTRILETKKAWDARSDKGVTFDITAVSGTSAGALCGWRPGMVSSPRRLSRVRIRGRSSRTHPH
jgi:hypothetical protein